MIERGGEALNALTQAWFAADAGTIDSLLVDVRETPIPNAAIARYAAALMASPAALAWLGSARGISASTAANFRLGLGGHRVIIPIFDQYGHCRNLRRYKPGGDPKMLGLRGRSMRLFPLRALADRREQPIVAVEGEFDAILGWQVGLRTLTAGGAGTLGPWRRNLSRFADERFRIVFDRDDAGRRGAERLRTMLKPVAAEVRVLRLPLDHPGADLSDWVLGADHGAA